MDNLKFLFSARMAVILFAIINIETPSLAFSSPKLGIVSFQKSMTDDLRGMLDKFYDNLEQILGEKFKNRLNAVVNQPVLIEQYEIFSFSFAFNNQDAIKYQLKKIAGSHHLDYVLWGYVDENLSENKFIIVLYFYSRNTKKIENVTKNILKPQLSILTVDKALTEMIEQLCLSTSQTKLPSPANSKITYRKEPPNPPDLPPNSRSALGKPPGVQEITVEDLLAYGKSDSTASKDPNTSAGQNLRVDEEIANLKAIYQLIYQNELYIHVHPSRYIDPSEKSKEKKYGTYAKELGISVNRLRELDEERFRLHKAALDDLKRMLNLTSDFDLYHDLLTHNRDQFVDPNKHIFLARITSKPKTRMGQPFNICLLNSFKPVPILFRDIKPLIQDFNTNRTQFKDWKVPTITELLAISEYIPPYGEPGRYWTSTKTSAGNDVWIVERDFRQRKDKKRPYYHYYFYRSGRYDVKEAKLLPIRICQ